MNLEGKKGVIMGVANDHSIAWGIAEQLHKNGADLCFTYQGEALQRRVEPLAESIGNDFFTDPSFNTSHSIKKLLLIESAKGFTLRCKDSP